jgi:hypothetical protein
MKVFLDENLPHALRPALAGHDVFTAKFMGWSGIKNGKLLTLVEAEGFQIFVTADQSIHDQQNFSERQIAMVYLTAQKWSILSLRVQEILAAIEAALPGSVHVVDCGKFRR